VGTIGDVFAEGTDEGAPRSEPGSRARTFSRAMDGQVCEETLSFERTVYQDCDDVHFTEMGSRQEPLRGLPIQHRSAYLQGQSDSRDWSNQLVSFGVDITGLPTNRCR